MALVIKHDSRVFSRDVTVAMLVTLNKGMAAMLVSPINPPGIELYSYANVFFCFGWKTCSLIDWVKTLLYISWNPSLFLQVRKKCADWPNGYPVGYFHFCTLLPLGRKCSLLPLRRKLHLLSFWVTEWVSECNNRIRAHNELCRLRSDISRS